MKILTIIIIIVLPFLLSSCGTMQKDCMTLLSGDRDAYRHCMANQGNSLAQYELGIAAFEVEDYATAINWLKRAARPKTSGLPNYIEPTFDSRRELVFEEDREPRLPGHTGALWLLERIYREGIGVPINLNQAERYREMINPVQ